MRRQSDEERLDCATLDCCYYVHHGNTDLVVRLRIWPCKRPAACNMVWTTRTGACRAAKRYFRTLMKVADRILNGWPLGHLWGWSCVLWDFSGDKSQKCGSLWLFEGKPGQNNGRDLFTTTPPTRSNDMTCSGPFRSPFHSMCLEQGNDAP